MIKIIMYIYKGYNNNYNEVIDMLKEYDSDFVKKFIEIKDEEISLTDKGKNKVKKFYERGKFLTFKEDLTDKETEELSEIIDVEEFLLKKEFENDPGTMYFLKNFLDKESEIEYELDLDIILDKISKSGINSLVEREKKFLDNYGKEG